MSNNPLKVVAASDKREGWISSKKNYRQEAQAKFDRLWLICPYQFYPSRNCMEMERIERTLQFIKDHIDLKGKKVADLGCGDGTITRRLRDLGAEVDAVDIAERALEQSDKDNINWIHDYVPRTKLADDAYDLVIASDLIAYLDSDEYRLFMAELSRIVKPSGYVLCSTPIDICSEDALQRFHGLSETEFFIEEWRISYHAFWLRIHDFFAAPSRFVKGHQEPEYRRAKLTGRTGIGYYWFKLNSATPLAYIWHGVQWLATPFNAFVQKNHFLLNSMEVICRTISSVRGISHVIWLGKRRPLVEFTPENERPVEHKGKKQVWE